MRQRALIGCVAVGAFLLYVFGSSASEHGPPAFDLVGDENHGLVDLAGGEGTPLGEEASALSRRSQGTEASAMAGESSSPGQSSEDAKAYREAVKSFAESYGDTIDRTNPLVHKLLMHSEGADRMAKTEIEELGDLLSDMGEAPNFEVIGSYPKGYVDCDRYLRAGATSLGLAAASIHGFNETADMEYLRDYRRLISMYMRAVADAQWCVSDHLHQAYLEWRKRRRCSAHGVLGPAFVSSRAFSRATLSAWLEHYVQPRATPLLGSRRGRVSWVLFQLVWAHHRAVYV